MAAKFKQSGQRHVPFFDSVMESGLLMDNVFAFSMEDTKSGLDSELTFGWIDHSKYVDKITWHDVVLPVFWSIKLDRVILSFKD